MENYSGPNGPIGTDPQEESVSANAHSHFLLSQRHYPAAVGMNCTREAPTPITRAATGPASAAETCTGAADATNGPWGVGAFSVAHGQSFRPDAEWPGYAYGPDYRWLLADPVAFRGSGGRQHVGLGRGHRRNRLRQHGRIALFDSSTPNSSSPDRERAPAPRTATTNTIRPPASRWDRTPGGRPAAKGPLRPPAASILPASTLAWR